MSYKTVSVEIRGVSPLIMHSSQLCDPRNEWVKGMKRITAKPAKSRTDDDTIELARLEFMGSMYINETGPVIPGINIEGMIVEGSKKSRGGKLAKSGIIVEGDWPLIYDGPRDADSLWGDKRFVSVASARVQSARVMRTRPKFPEWALKFEATYLPQVVSLESVKEWIEAAGLLCGLGDWKPRYGRFVVESFE
jgi:hypothetical protein